VARQVQGEYVLVRTEKAFKEAVLAEALANKLKNNYVKAVNLSTPHGNVECMCECGVFEIELEN
jgi:hypothetical protein